MHYVIADCDGSMDDLMALMILLTDPNTTVLAITIPGGTGEVHGQPGAENIARLCTLLGKKIPIGFSETKSFNNLGTDFPDWLRPIVDNIFQGTELQDYQHDTQFKDAVTLIKEVVEHQPDHSVIIQATGPLTNIADFTRQYPHLVRKFSHMIVMGGAVGVPGNIRGLIKDSPNLKAEWNFFADPMAAKIALNVGIKTILVALDATNQIPMTKEFYQAFKDAENPALKFIHKIQTDLIKLIGEDDFYKEFFLWDPLTALLLIMPQLIARTVEMWIEVDVSGDKETNGQTKEIPAAEKTNVMLVTELRNPEEILPNLVKLYTERLGYFSQRKLDTPPQEPLTQCAGVLLTPHN